MRRCLWMALLLAAGCVNDRRDGYDPVVGIAFSPAMYSSVRAAGESYPDDLPFGICAWALPADLRWEMHRDAAGAFLADERVARRDAVWATERPADWPSADLRLSFLGYAPYGAAGGCDRYGGVRFTGTDTAADQTDLLYTDPIADLSKFTGGGVVPVEFRHALCKVDFRVHRSVAGGGAITVRRIEIEAVRHRGDFASLRDPQWQLAGEAAPELFFEGEAEARTSIRPIGRARFLIPQRIDCAVRVEFDYTNAGGGTIRQRLSTRPLDADFEAGRRYTLTLALMPDQVQFLSEAMDLETE